MQNVSVCAKEALVSDLSIREWYFVTKIVLTYCEKKMFEIRKNFEITRKIYSRSERSEEFLDLETWWKS